MIYYFVEFAGSFANIALLVLFVDRLFQKKDLSSRWFYLYIALLIVGQCLLSLFPTWVMPRTIYFLLGGFLLAILFYEAQIWQAIFASAAFFTLVAVVEVLAMLLMGLQVSDTDALMQAGSARLIYVVFSNLIQIPLLILISHFFSRKENVLRILWLLPIIAIQIASIAVCYVVQYHAADENFPDYLIGLMVVLLLMNILIVFYVEALRKNEQEKFRAEFNEQQYRLQMEYYQQLKERQEETRALWHDIKKYILAMQAVAERGNSEELYKIVRDATDAFERSKNISTLGNPVVDALLNQYLPELTIQEVREQILEAHHMEKGRRLLKDYDLIMDKVAEAEELGLSNRSSTLEKLAELAGTKEKCDAPECNPTGCRKARNAHEL